MHSSKKDKTDKPTALIGHRRIFAAFLSFRCLMQTREIPFSMTAGISESDSLHIFLTFSLPSFCSWEGFTANFSTGQANLLTL